MKAERDLPLAGHSVAVQDEPVLQLLPLGGHLETHAPTRCNHGSLWLLLSTPGHTWPLTLCAASRDMESCLVRSKLAPGFLATAPCCPTSLLSLPLSPPFPSLQVPPLDPDAFAPCFQSQSLPWSSSCRQRSACSPGTSAQRSRGPCLTCEFINSAFCLCILLRPQLLTLTTGNARGVQKAHGK